LKEIIKQFVENCNKAKIDSIVVFIMSHGEAGKDSTRSSDILTADGVRFNTDWLVEQFEPNKSKRNVPKLFFVQACR
jgi:ABC-type sulfate transport system substrate-binding protein